MRRRCAFALAGIVLLLGGLASPAAAARPPAEIVLPPEVGSTEGIAAGRGRTFYVGELNEGDIFRGNLRSGQVSLLVDAPEGRAAVGLAFDRRHHRLFVAGGPTGQGYVYDARTGAELAVFQLATAPTFVNDVVLTRDAAWFTDSMQTVLHRVPIGRRGALGAPEVVPLTGPAASQVGDFWLNGIEATRDGATLVVAHSGLGQLFAVDAQTGASAAIVDRATGAPISVPNADGIMLRGRHLWVVQNFSNQVSVIRLSGDLSSGVVTDVITSPLFEVPTTGALFGSRLAVVNAKFGVQPPPTQFEVVVVKA